MIGAMRIAVLGTGMVGQSLAGGLARLRHEVTVGTRDPQASLARLEAGGFGAWAALHAEVRVATFADAAAGADLVVNALSGDVSVAGVGAASIADGTVLLDVANPLEFRPGRAPSLFLSNTDSLGELLQRTFPTLRVVKSLNTMTAPLMVAPHDLADGDFSTFVCGDDAEAKTLVTGLLAGLGHTDLIDLGDITASRGVESMMLVWLRLMGVLGSARFTYKIVR